MKQSVTTQEPTEREVFLAKLTLALSEMALLTLVGTLIIGIATALFLFPSAICLIVSGATPWGNDTHNNITAGLLGFWLAAFAMTNCLPSAAQYVRECHVHRNGPCSLKALFMVLLTQVGLVAFSACFIAVVEDWRVVGIVTFIAQLTVPAGWFFGDSPPVLHLAENARRDLAYYRHVKHGQKTLYWWQA